MGCIAGINITASHNPPEYNGYKVYWEDGAQITPPHDTGIMAEVKAVTDFASMKTMDKAEAVKAGLYEQIGEPPLMMRTLPELKKQVKHWDSIEAEEKELKDRLHAPSRNRKYSGQTGTEGAWLYQCLCSSGAGASGR